MPFCTWSWLSLSLIYESSSTFENWLQYWLCSTKWVWWKELWLPQLQQEESWQLHTNHKFFEGSAWFMWNWKYWKRIASIRSKAKSKCLGVSRGGIFASAAVDDSSAACIDNRKSLQSKCHKQCNFRIIWDLLLLVPMTMTHLLT